MTDHVRDPALQTLLDSFSVGISPITGAVSVVEVIDGHLKRRVYFDYTEFEARCAFYDEFQDELAWMLEEIRKTL